MYLILPHTHTERTALTFTDYTQDELLPTPEAFRNVSFKLINLKYFTTLGFFFSGALCDDVLIRQQEKGAENSFNVTIPLTQRLLLCAESGSCERSALEGMSWAAEPTLHNGTGCRTQSLSGLLAISIIHCTSSPATSFILCQCRTADGWQLKAIIPTSQKSPSGNTKPQRFNIFPTSYSDR